MLYHLLHFHKFWRWSDHHYLKYKGFKIWSMIASYTMKVKADRHQKLISWAPYYILHFHQVWRLSKRKYSKNKGFVIWPWSRVQPSRSKSIIVKNQWAKRFTAFYILTKFDDDRTKTTRKIRYSSSDDKQKNKKQKQKKTV